MISNRRIESKINKTICDHLKKVRSNKQKQKDRELFWDEQLAKLRH